MSSTEEVSKPSGDLVTAAAGRYRAVDALYATPYIDVDEWREDPEPHRYIHGGFTDTDLRFSYYFPPVERYAGRFLQPVLMISGTEHAATSGLMYGQPGSPGFAFDSGAYMVESNMGCLSPMPGPDPSIPGFRGSAAAARFSRAVAAEVYGEVYGEHRPYGYVYGGSGGAFKTIACFENAPDVWDGAVPFVQGSPIAIPNCFSIQAHAMRLLDGVFPQITDALEPGGSGDMYAGLNEEEREALAEVTRMGFPPESWFGYETMGVHAFAVLYPGIVMADPGYFTDFWTVPGYLGANPPESLLKARVRHRSTIARELRRITAPLPVRFVFKASYDKANRTSVDAYRGPGLEAGLNILRRVKEQADVAILTDVHDVQQVGPAA